MKLTRPKLIETIRRKNEGWTTYQARKIAGISIRRVNQVWNEYQLTNEVPDIGKRNGRPSKPVEEWEIDMVRQTYQKYRVSADTLERLILRDFQEHIGHNRIHKILLILGFAKKKNKKDIRKKDWIRYERRHSLTAVHIDWHQRPNDGPWTFAVEDDASRKLLALVESEKESTEKSAKSEKQKKKKQPEKQAKEKPKPKKRKRKADKEDIEVNISEHNSDAKQKVKPKTAYPDSGSETNNETNEEPDKTSELINQDNNDNAQGA